MTEDQFKKLLTTELAAQDKRLEARLDARLAEHTEQFNAQLNMQLADFFGKMTAYFDKKFDHEIGAVNTRIDAIQVADDALAQRVNTDEVERAALAHQTNRHEAWIGQLAAQTNATLVPELN